MVQQPVGEVGVVAGSLAADSYVLPAGPAGLDRAADQELDGGVALVEAGGDQAGVAIQTQGELGQVVGADREPVEVVKELIGQKRVRGQLAHHDDLEAVLAALQPVLGKQVDHAAGLVDRPDEGNHDLDVGQPHLVADVAQGLALHGEALGEVR